VYITIELDGGHIAADLGHLAQSLTLLQY